MASERETRTKGFRKQMPGAIHIRCPKCGRKLSNVKREPGDPPSAWLIEVPCDKPGCSMGMEPECPYFDAQGNQVFVDSDPERGPTDE